LLYIGNYLPKDHPYLSLSKEELLKKFIPFLKKINPHFRPSSIVSSELFFGPFAQPVFPVNYSRHIPEFETPIKNVFLANMDMVYPWDRGTNYAVEIGKNIAEFISHQT
jgi:protoporphyrinogen oxidase